MKSFLSRIYYALGPLAAGIMIDVLDLATFGPVGIALGAAVGAYAGWVIGEFEGLSRNGRVTLACCAGIYMMIPSTEPLPIATVFTLVARFFREPPKNPKEDESP